MNKKMIVYGLIAVFTTFLLMALILSFVDSSKQIELKGVYVLSEKRGEYIWKL